VQHGGGINEKGGKVMGGQVGYVVSTKGSVRGEKGPEKRDRMESMY